MRLDERLYDRCVLDGDCWLRVGNIGKKNEPVTRKVNIGRAAAVRTACPHGHDYTPENTYRSPKGERRCRTCKRALDRKLRSGQVAA